MAEARVFDWERERVFSTLEESFSREMIIEGIASGALLVSGVCLSALGCRGLSEAETLS